jgi:conjugative transposon TraN protein
MRYVMIVGFVLQMGISVAQGVQRIAVSRYKTVSLVFPTFIISTDRGSDRLLVQKSAENILKLKAAVDTLPESSLTVITGDGKLYAFLVHFTSDSVELTHYFGAINNTRPVHPLAGECERVMKMKHPVTGIKFRSGKVTAESLGWFVNGSRLYCKIRLANRSQIGYDIEQFRFYLRDNLLMKHTASQEIEQKPLNVHGDTGTIKASSARVWVIALDKFTIPDDKHFAVEILEKNGGRHLYLRLYNRQLMNAKVL